MEDADSNFRLSARPKSKNWSTRNDQDWLYKSLLAGFEYNNSNMGKKSFVRVLVGKKLYRLDRSDITRTHFIKKKAVPPVPCFFKSVRNNDCDLELENTTFYDVCFKREESSEDEWEGAVVDLAGGEELKC